MPPPVIMQRGERETTSPGKALVAAAFEQASAVVVLSGGWGVAINAGDAFG